MGTVWHKIGYDQYNIRQRAIDGWWDCSHPEELCGKLDVRHVKLIRVWWKLDKKTEQDAHKMARGGTLKRKAHNEFYAEGSDYELMLTILGGQYQYITDAGNIHPPMVIPPVRYQKEKVCVNCGGRPLNCRYCEEDIRRKEWSRHINTKKHRDNVNAKMGLRSDFNHDVQVVRIGAPQSFGTVENVVCHVCGGDGPGLACLCGASSSSSSNAPTE